MNIVAGHSPEEQRSYGDFLDHDRRYERTDEFLAVCHAFWRGEKDIDFAGQHYRIDKGNLSTPFVSDGRRHPEIYIAGNSEPAERLSVSRGDCWMQIADTAQNVRESAARVRDKGIEVGLRMSVITRPTHEEAVAAAYSLVESARTGGGERRAERSFMQRSDSVSIRDTYHRAAEQDWLGPALLGRGRPHPRCAGHRAGRFARGGRRGDPGIQGRGDLPVHPLGMAEARSMEFFGTHILPIVRRMECESSGSR